MTVAALNDRFSMWMKQPATEDDATLGPHSSRGEIDAGPRASKARLSLWLEANAAGDEGEASAQ